MINTRTINNISHYCLFVFVLILFSTAWAGQTELVSPDGEKSEIKTEKKEATIHYKQTNFAKEFNNPDLKDFGEKVDQGIKENNVHTLTMLSLELLAAEKVSGEKIKPLTSGKLQSIASDIAKLKQQKKGFDIVAAGYDIMGNKDKKKLFSEMGSNIQKKANAFQYDLFVINQTYEDLDIYVNGIWVGTVFAYGSYNFRNAGPVGFNIGVARGYDWTYTSRFRVGSFQRHFWTIN